MPSVSLSDVINDDVPPALDLDFPNMTIHCENYRCFRDGIHGICGVKPLNLIIGRNNSGKSAFADAIECVFSSQKVLIDETKNPTVYVGRRNSEEELANYLACREGNDIASYLAGRCATETPVYEKKFSASNSSGADFRWVGFMSADAVSEEKNIEVAGEVNEAARLQELRDLGSPADFKSKFVVHRLMAERTIKTEAGGSVSGNLRCPKIGSDGTGVTSAFHFIDQSPNTAMSGKLSQEILMDLNSVFAPEYKFASISTKSPAGSGGWIRTF